ncbi:MAG: aspartate kinase [Vicinamibacterales bacterium]|nr:aspartate kinase [Vicinamibacterales bacterium]
MVTLKFGGTSVADVSALRRLCAIVAAQAGPRVVVVSALSGITDQLLALAQVAEQGRLAEALEIVRVIRARHDEVARVADLDGERLGLRDDLAGPWTDLDALVRAVAILRAAPPAVRDAIAACGELLSSRVVAAALRSAGVAAAWVDARQVVATDARHERAVPLRAETAARAEACVRPLLRRGLVPVLGGFVGATVEGVTTTLGRGGSDYSASLIGAALGAREIQIWTDTDGVLTADPRVIDAATTVDGLSCREASALAHFGAKVLHPATMAPAMECGIPVRILNSRRPDARGTVVTSRPARRHNPLAGVACVPDVVVLDVALPPDAAREGVLADVFGVCAAHGATVYASSIGDAEITITLGAGPAAGLAAAVLTARGPVSRRDDLALLVAVGDGLSDRRAHTAEILRALEGIPVAALAESSRAGFVAVAIPRAALRTAMAAVHACFFEAQEDPVHVPVPAFVRLAVTGMLTGEEAVL